jgi:RNA polymerase sigma-70 factor (ECF subfamily)
MGRAMMARAGEPAQPRFVGEPPCDADAMGKVLRVVFMVDAVCGTRGPSAMAAEGARRGFPDDETLRWIQPRIREFFRRRLPAHVDPADLVAEVMTAFAKYRGDASPMHYAFRVARRQLAQLHRQPARFEPLPTTQHRTLVDPQTGGSTHVRRSELAQALRTQVDTMPEPYGEVVRLHLGGHSSREIAAQLAVNPNTVRSRLSRGLAWLKQRLELVLHSGS